MPPHLTPTARPGQVARGAGLVGAGRRRLLYVPYSLNFIPCATR